MQALLFAFVLFIYVTMTWVDAITTASFGSGKANINVILGFEVVTFNDFFGVIKMPSPNTEWIFAVWGAVTWDFWFFNGVMSHVRMLVGLLGTAFMGWGLMTVVIPILISAVSTLIQGVRATTGIFRRGG